ncbi:hypothetical protein MMC25_007261 [Agyrium rufum]|nr:hypothetical protein [Agyrium rufum]
MDSDENQAALLATHEPTERDVFSEAPEVDYAAQAPQASYGIDPQLYTDQLLKGATHIREDDAPERYIQDVVKLRAIIVAAVTTFAIIVAVGLGSGLGIGLSNHNKGGDGTTGTRTNTSTSEPTSTSIPLHGIMNDSSFAVTSTVNSRHLFFQDVNGTIREAISPLTSDTWESDDIHFILLEHEYAQNARNNTPLAATTLIGNANDVPYELLLLFYVNTSNVLTYSVSFQGIWYTEDILSGQYGISVFGIGTPSLPRITIGAQSKLLSITKLSDSDLEAFLLFIENADGEPSAWYFGSSGPSGWVNISSQLLESLVPDSSDASGQGGLSLPKEASFASGIVNFDNGSGASSRVAQFTILLAVDNLAPVYFTDPTNGTFSPANTSGGGWGGFGASFSDNTTDYMQCSACGGGNYYFWVNGTSLSGLQVTLGPGFGSQDPPPTSFPFGRFAATSYNSTNYLYIYHQLNASTFSEETFDIEGQSWSSLAITVPTT